MTHRIVFVLPSRMYTIRDIWPFVFISPSPLYICVLYLFLRMLAWRCARSENIIGVVTGNVGCCVVRTRCLGNGV